MINFTPQFLLILRRRIERNRCDGAHTFHMPFRDTETWIGDRRSTIKILITGFVPFRAEIRRSLITMCLTLGLLHFDVRKCGPGTKTSPIDPILDFGRNRFYIQAERTPLDTTQGRITSLIISEWLFVDKSLVLLNAVATLRDSRPLIADEILRVCQRTILELIDWNYICDKWRFPFVHDIDQLIIEHTLGKLCESLISQIVHHYWTGNYANNPNAADQTITYCFSSHLVKSQSI